MTINIKTTLSLITCGLIHLIANHLMANHCPAQSTFSTDTNVVAEQVNLQTSLGQPATPTPVRWQVVPNRGIEWDVAASAPATWQHGDDIEMAGRQVAGIIAWTVDEERSIRVRRKIIFPQIHPQLQPGDPPIKAYRAYLTVNVPDQQLPELTCNEQSFEPGPVKAIQIDGCLRIIHQANQGIQVHRRIFPSAQGRLFLEQWSLKNTTDQPIQFSGRMQPRAGQVEATDGTAKWKVAGQGLEQQSIGAGQTHRIAISVAATLGDEPFPAVDADQQWQGRADFLRQVTDSLVLETPDPVLNELFRFSKIRGSENVFDSKLGVIHSPGGGRYYVGIWANDQAEYINPFFAYLKYPLGHESAMNCYRAFAGEMNPQYKPMRYAFEIEGTVRPFIKDRGDAAMIAVGASHYALATGSAATAKELWPLIQWCLEYCHRRLNDQGVVRSQSDEMEGRIATGDANLSTSSLYYGALRHAVDLGRALDQPADQIQQYQQRADALRAAIEKYFGGQIEGLNTYRYYAGHQHLRHWICLPLVVGIHDRSAGTTEALFDRLWSENGVHVEKNSDNPNISKIFWDRGTLYALRGALIAGATQRAMDKLNSFSRQRLLGDRVPYVVEAFPEGGMAHLSAESGLYCRVFTEGLFGINPTGLNSFSTTPRLPAGWPEMKLRRATAFGQTFDIGVRAQAKQLAVRVSFSDSGKTVLESVVEPGTQVDVQF